MKYFIKALVYELGGMLMMAILAGIVFGIVKLTYYVAGDDRAPGVLILMLLAAVQLCITWERAQALKRSDK
jgi:hypothetical protein